MVDELILSSEQDPELADSIKWLSAQADKKGISFYQIVFDTLYRHDINNKASLWLRDKN